MNTNVGSILESKEETRYEGRYSFPKFSNDFVAVEPEGNFIKICIKDEQKGACCSWEFTHPFHKCKRKYERLINGWDVCLKVSNKNEINIFFVKRLGHDSLLKEERHRLVLECTDPKNHPKPVQITWE